MICFSSLCFARCAGEGLGVGVYPIPNEGEIIERELGGNIGLEKQVRGICLI